MNNKVKFLRGTSNEYAVAEKDSDTIYFTTDDGKLYIGDKEVSGDGSLTIDDTLSDTSTNPVQNKVVKQAIDNKADKSKYGDSTINVGRKAETTVGKYSTAEGNNTTASGDGSHSEGYNTIASGNPSHAEGISTVASSGSSHAEGLCTTASGSPSHAEGNGTTASGASSHSEGFSTIASGNYSHAEGNSTTASGANSHAGGIGTKALHDNEAAYGKYNESNDNTLFSVGDGTADDARHNAFEITTTGGKLHDKDIATTDLIPTSLPANGGNADTVDGKHADDFIKSVADIHRTSLDDCITGGTYAVSSVYTTDMPTQYGMWGICDVRVYELGIFQTIKYTDTAIVICRSKILNQSEWSEWKEISTTPIKSTGRITSPTDQYGTIILPNSSTRRYLSITAVGCYAEMFLFNDKYTVHIVDGNYEKIISTPITYNAFYIE